MNDTLKTKCEEKKDNNKKRCLRDSNPHPRNGLIYIF